MNESSIIVMDPVTFHDGALCLRLQGALVPLKIGQDPVTTFVPGWRPVFFYAGFAPFVLLQFSSDSGEVAVWIVDADGIRLGGSVEELSLDVREALRIAATPRVAQLTTAILQQSMLSLDAQSRAFLCLPEGLRRDIGQLCAVSALPPVRRVVLHAVPAVWDDAWGLDRGHVETLLATPFQERLLLAAKDGMLSWPSPADGRTLTVQGSLCSDDFRFAYRLADPVHEMVCYPIVSHHHSTTLGLYVPVLDLLVVRDGWAAGWLDIYVPSLADWMVPLLCRFGDALESYFCADTNHVASIMRGWPATHLGHQLWNELSGIDWFLQSASGPHFPRWIVPGVETELWGPIDQVFPAIEGLVDRSAPNADFAIKASYQTGVCLVRVTSEYVSAALRAGLRQSLEADPVYNEARATIQSRTQPDAPVLLLGLRVENRTMVDLLEFCEEFLEFMAATFPGVIIVLDGHNSGYNGKAIVSHGEFKAWRSPLDVEREIAGHLRRLQVGRDVLVVDTLGAPIRTSLAWCAQSDGFFSIWGASLSKYRWACNKPGLVVTNAWNLTQRTDLHIYDSPDFMEAPTRLSFVDAGQVEDFDDAPLLIAFGPDQPSFANFKIKASDVLNAFSEMVLRLKEH